MVQRFSVGGLALLACLARGFAPPSRSSRLRSPLIRRQGGLDEQDDNSPDEEADGEASKGGDDYWAVTAEDVTELVGSLKTNIARVKSGEASRGPKRYEELTPEELEVMMTAGKAEMNKTFSAMLKAVKERSSASSQVDNPYLSEEQNANLRAMREVRKVIDGEEEEGREADVSSIMMEKLLEGQGTGGADPIAAVDSIIETVEEMKKKLKETSDALEAEALTDLKESAAMQREKLETLTSVYKSSADSDVFPPRPEDEVMRKELQEAAEKKDEPFSLLRKLGRASVCGEGPLKAPCLEELESLGFDMASTEGESALVVLASKRSPEELTALLVEANATHVVLMSQLGTRRASQGIASFFGQGDVDRARAVEDAAKLRQSKVAGSLSVVRVGSPDKAQGPCLLSIEDDLEGGTALEVAAAGLARAALYARNASVSVTGLEQPKDWDDLLLKCDGPEVARLYAAPSTDVGELRAWLGEWAKLWLGGTTGARLTTKVQVDISKNGAVTMLFVDPKARKTKPNGGLELTAEYDPVTANPRVRAARANYGTDGLAIKVKSETAILDKLKDDCKATWGSL